MKSVFDWIIKNAWNLFGGIGVVATFYFSLMHVPDYIKNVTTGKVNIIHENLMDDVQELLFYDKMVSIEVIDSFIKGKELKQGVSYPYNPDQLLVQIQERFMGNKFIPLEKRESLFKKIESIRSQYTAPVPLPEKSLNWTIIFSWLLSGVGVIIAFLGAFSITKKLKRDQETEIDIISGDIAINHDHGNVLAPAVEYENMVGEILNELGVLKPSDNTNYDFLVSKKNKEFIVEVKRYSRLLGLGTAQGFMYTVNNSGRGGILVVSSGVTQRTKELIENHNKISDNQKVYLIVGESKSSVKKQFMKLFKATSKN